MSQHSRTKEENFLVRFAAMEDCERDLAVEEVATRLQMNPKTLKNIVRMLAQANAIKKRGNSIRLTPHGRHLAETV